MPPGRHHGAHLLPSLMGGMEMQVVNERCCAGPEDGRSGCRVDCRSAAHGLLRGSHIPDRAERELRELVRYRKAVRRRSWTRTSPSTIPATGSSTTWKVGRCSGRAPGETVSVFEVRESALWIDLRDWREGSTSTWTYRTSASSGQTADPRRPRPVQLYHQGRSQEEQRHERCDQKPPNRPVPRYVGREKCR